jgi:hypothetical protein
MAEIQTQLDESGIVGTTDTDTLIENYAATLEQTLTNIASDPRRLVTDLLKRCQMWAEIIEQRLVELLWRGLVNTYTLYRHGRIGEGFKDTFDRLLAIRNSLESRSLLQAWSLRETDLWSYQRQLDRIDESRAADGSFVNALGQPADLQTQRVREFVWS